MASRFGACIGGLTTKRRSLIVTTLARSSAAGVFGFLVLFGLCRLMGRYGVSG